MKLKSKRRMTRRSKLGVICISITVTLIALITLLLWSEGGLTSKAALWEVLENSLIALLGEYPDEPRTITGRVIQLFLLIVGTLGFGAVIGTSSSFFITRALLEEKPMTDFQDHIMICNWNEKAPAILEQLLEANKQEPRDIVIISASVIENVDNLKEQSNIHFIQADPTHHGTLEKFKASKAKSIIILADEESEVPDEKNALIALAVKHLEETPGQQKDIHVIGELINLDRYRHLKEAGVDELVSAREYSSGIIAQSAVFRNMSVIYQQLLTYSDDSNEFYFIEPGQYPEHLYGKTFPELSKWVSEESASHPDNPLLLMGIKRGDGEILLNPRWSHFDKLRTNDSLIIMAFHNIKRLE